MSTPITEIQTRFRQTDSAGILFFAEIFHLAHDAYEDWVQQLGFSHSEWFSHPEWAVPLVHSSADFMVPIRAGETLKIEAELLEVSKKSFTVKWHLKKEERVAATCTTKHTFIDKSNFSSMEIPQTVREALQKFQK